MKSDYFKIMLITLKNKNVWKFPLSMRFNMLQSLLKITPVRSSSGYFLYASSPPIGGRGFKKYINGMKELYSGNHTPLIAHLSLTNKCDYNCDRCSNISNTKKDPSFESIKNAIDKLKNAGTALIAFTGGEPALRNDLEDIISLCGKDVSASLFTTGINIDNKRAEKLKKAGLESVYISLDSHIEEDHNKNRNNKNAFKNSLSAIKALQNADIYTAAQMVISKETIAIEMFEKYLLFLKSINIPEVMVLEPFPLKQEFCHKKFNNLKNKLIDIHKKYFKNKNFPKVTTMSFLESKNFMGCMAGVGFIYINTDGDVFPCDFFPISFGNIKKDSMKNILNEISSKIPCPGSKCIALHHIDILNKEKSLPVSFNNSSKYFTESNTKENLPKMMKWFGKETNKKV